MAFFQSFTNSIKQKWLQFFQVNRDWIILHMAVESVYTPDGGKRPSSYLILGVINALDPKLAQLMLPFAKLNSDADTLIEVLDLHFDPDIALGNSLNPAVEPDIHSHDLTIDSEDSFPNQPGVSADLNSLGEESVAQELNIGDTAEELSHPPTTDKSELDQISLTSDFDSVQPETILGLEDTADKLDEFSFEAETLTDEMLDGSSLDDLNTSPDESSFRDVLSDVWGDENSLSQGEENGNILGEDLPSEVFDEAEIARLFPNS